MFNSQQHLSRTEHLNTKRAKHEYLSGPVNIYGKPMYEHHDITLIIGCERNRRPVPNLLRETKHFWGPLCKSYL